MMGVAAAAPGEDRSAGRISLFEERTDQMHLMLTH